MMRQPTTPAEQAECEAAYESGRLFDVARWEKPGCKYIGVTDRRSNGSRCGFVIVAEPGSAYFDVLPAAQIIRMVDKGVDHGLPQIIDLDRHDEFGPGPGA